MKVLSVAILLGALAMSSGNPFDSRIIGGYEIDIREVPYQVYFGLCGGVILTRRHIATAGHCFNVRSPIRAGSSNKNEGGQLIQVANRVRHPEYLEIFGIAVNDFALLILAEDLVFNEHVQAIPLAQNPAPDGTIFHVSGWGLFQNGNTVPDLLQAVKVPQINLESCKNVYDQYSSVMSDKMFCAGFEEGDRDACHGDSGGPAVVNNTLYGIVSWGPDCNKPREGAPGVYASIPKVYDWYMSYIQDYVE